jgi:hypothetical protein
MSKKSDSIEDKVKEDFFEEIEEIEEERSRNQHNPNSKKRIWMMDISDEFFDLKEYYLKIEYRLKWVDMNDILYGPRSIYPIRYDEHINEFINDFMVLLDSILNRIKRKKLVIIQDDEFEFNRLKSLNGKKIYSRIAFCLQKWCI